MDRHSLPITTKYTERMKVFTVPALQNSYSHILLDCFTKEAAVIDPFESELVEEVVKREKINLKSALYTCRSSGDGKIGKMFPGIDVFGFDENTPGLTNKLSKMQLIPVGNLRVRAIPTPGHTISSAMYHVLAKRSYRFGPNTNPHSVLFTGETLDIGGCCRVVEGTVKDLYEVLTFVMGKMPSDTELFSAKENGWENLEFTRHMARVRESDEVNEGTAIVERKIERKYPSCPMILEDEYLHNPFLRVHMMGVFGAFDFDRKARVAAWITLEKLLQARAQFFSGQNVELADEYDLSEEEKIMRDNWEKTDALVAGHLSEDGTEILENEDEVEEPTRRKMVDEEGYLLDSDYMPLKERLQMEEETGEFYRGLDMDDEGRFELVCYTLCFLMFLSKGC